MATAYIDSAVGQNTLGTNATSGGIASTGASVLVVAVAYFDGLSGILPASAISDNQGNTGNFVALTNYASTGGIANSSLRFYYVENPATAGSGHTATVSAGSNIIAAAIAIIAISGTLTSGVFDVQNGATPSSDATTRQTGSVTPSQNGAAILTAVALADSNSGIAVDSGFTLAAGNSGTPGNVFGIQIAYLIPQSTAAAVNPQFSASGATFRSAAIAVFAETGGGGGGNPWYAYNQMRQQAI